MNDTAKYQSEWLTVQVNAKKNETKLIFKILDRTFEILDKSIPYQTLRFENKKPYDIAKKIHDNIVVDGLLFKQINDILISNYRSQLWRFLTNEQ